jgi:hypothetical protein
MAKQIAKRSRDSKRLAVTPRARLDSLQRVRLEMVAIYRAARDGERDVGDASKLMNMLALIGRIIEGGELEQRLEALEKAQGGPR